MRTITSIQHIQFFMDKNDIKRVRTFALVKDELGNLEEAVGFGKNFKVGDRVEYFHHRGQNKMRLTS